MPTLTDFARFDFEPNDNTSGGDYGQTADAPIDAVQFGNYPNLRGYGFDADNPEFSSNVSGEPLDLAAETANSMSAFAELQQFLMNNLETLGSRVVHESSKPWTSPTEER